MTRAYPCLLLCLAFVFSCVPRGHAGEAAESEEIAEGLLYERIEEWKGQQLVAHILRVGLREETFLIRSLKARGKETLRTMVKRLNGSGERVLGAINGDFFHRNTSAGIPHGVQVSDGRLVFGPRKRSAIGFGTDNKPYIGIVNFHGRLGIESEDSKKAQRVEIDGFNLMPTEFDKEDGVLLYSPDLQQVEWPRYKGLAVVVEKVTPALQVGDECTGMISTATRATRSLKIPEDGCVLRFLGEHARKYAKILRPGAQLRIQLSLPPIKGAVPQAIGGGPRLVRKGKVTVEFSKEDFARLHAMELNHKRHPRSAVGYDRARKHLYLVMVEGRHAESKGLTMKQLAEFMRRLGCYDAMAFDGGGSAAMYVLGRDIVSKSMGGGGRQEERRIANSLLLSVKRITVPGNDDGKEKEQEDREEDVDVEEEEP